MRFGSAGQFSGTIWLMAALLFAATVGAPLLFAQETPAQIEANRVASPRFAGFEFTKTDAKGRYVNQQPLRTEESGRRRLLYRTIVVEVPTIEVQTIIDQWKLIGGASSTLQNASSSQRHKTAIMPAAFTVSTTEFGIRLTTGLSDALVDELLAAGKKIISYPEIVGGNGEEVSLRVGQDLQFVAAYKPAKDENGKATAMQPVFGTIHDGIQLGLTGVLDDDRENVHLEFNLTNTQITEENAFTYESKDGPLTVQQPKTASTTIQTSCKAPVNNTIALCSGPVMRETLVKQDAPVVGRIPYVGKAFRRTVKLTEAISTIIFIRCEEQSAEQLDSPLNP